jgi:cytochrome c5
MAIRPAHGLLILVVAGAGALAGCLPPRDHAQLPPVSPAMTAWASAQWPDASPAQLSHGRETMESHCTACHSMPSPLHETAKDWPEVMQDMAEKAKLPTADEVAMLRFILAARASMPDHG